MLDKQNILYITESAVLGGAEISLFELITNLDRERFNPFIICSEEGPLIEKFNQWQIPNAVIPLYRVRQISFWRFLKSVKELVKFLKTNEIKLVHTNSTRANFLGALAARIVRVPVVWHVRNLVAPSLFIDLEKYFTFLPAAIITNSHATAKRFPHAQKKVTVIYNGLDLRVFNPGISKDTLHKEFNISLKTKIVAVVGRLGPGKGQEVFLQAVSLLKEKVQDVKFFIVGSAGYEKDVPIEESLKTQIKSLGLEKDVIFTGFRKDRSEVMASIDILVSPESITGQAFGKVLAEAQATGVPVIVTDAGAASEVVEKDATGILVPMRDATSLAEAIKFLLDNEELSNKMGQAGRARAEKLFNIKETTKEIEQIYIDLLNKA
ncbi:MAG: glycosyltransferase family 4 protein [Candidatus Omnitrophica bacterium]|nr:glycosyltransferase family 4 protein [Candidatus Omnitrophota bacterium]